MKLERSYSRKSGYNYPYFEKDLIKEIKKHFDDGEPTAEDVIKYIFGHYDSYSGDYYIARYEKSNRNFIQRMNMIWFVPIFIILIIPIQYLFCGKVGFTRTSRLGKFIDFIVGLD